MIHALCTRRACEARWHVAGTRKERGGFFTRRVEAHKPARCAVREVTIGDLHHGRGRRAYLRKRDALKRRVKREGLVCGQGGNFGCGEPFDLTIAYPHRMSFTADHPDALNNGGHLVKQDLVPMHLGCNSRKNDAAEVEIWEAS